MKSTLIAYGAGSVWSLSYRFHTRPDHHVNTYSYSAVQCTACAQIIVARDSLGVFVFYEFS